MKATKLKLCVGLAVALVAAAIVPAGASASFHLMQIREVYPGSVANPDSEYVELQMYAGGQNHVNGHTLTAYGPTGASETYTFDHDVARGVNQSTLLIASPEAATQFGVTPDLSIDKNALEPSGGAVCWETLDCVEWGSFTGAVLPSATGDAAAPIGDGLGLRRTIAPGCATLLEAGDDSDDSAADFLSAAPAPRPNSVAPTEKTCVLEMPPKTSIDSGPKKQTKSTKARFEFSSNQPASTFECSLDEEKFRACTSPHTYNRLKPGKHHFEVRATAAGKTDASPARYNWKVKRKHRK
jgi:hypothetical protein